MIIFLFLSTLSPLEHNSPNIGIKLHLLQGLGLLHELVCQLGHLDYGWVYVVTENGQLGHLPGQTHQSRVVVDT